MSFIFKIPFDDPDEDADLRICFSQRGENPDQYRIEAFSDGLKAEFDRCFERDAFKNFVNGLEALVKADPSASQTATLASVIVKDFELQVRGRKEVRHVELRMSCPRRWTVSIKHLNFPGEISLRLETDGEALRF